MSAQALDRPVWNLLRGPQAALACASGPVYRIDPAFGPFAAADPGHEAELAGLLTGPGDEIWIVETGELAPPPGTRMLRSAKLAQMIWDGPLPSGEPDPEIMLLSEADAPEMAALALATQPGPWHAQTRRYGGFYGVRRGGRLAAMAGERMRPAPGLAEISAVCTWPEFRGAGLAARLIRHVGAGFAARGDTPFLHSYAANTDANRLYEKLGFRLRREMIVTVLGRADA
jgi:ribosomal protein S18 acetylase RimI-like enzyme